MYVLKTLLERWRRGRETLAYPDGPAPELSDRYTGALRLETQRCAEGCAECLPVCPTAALAKPEGGAVSLDLGRCVSCALCVEACPTHALTATGDARMAARRRDDLLLGGSGRAQVRLADALEARLRRLLGRSLRLRQVSAGGCNACEADVNVLNTTVWDVGRFGIQLVASPRHADGLLVTGPVSRNMELALRKTWEAVPEPRLVIAVGACAISGGPFAGSPEARGGVASLLPVDLFVPGCPPHPLTILDGLLRLLGRLPEA